MGGGVCSEIIRRHQRTASSALLFPASFVVLRRQDASRNRDSTSRAVRKSGAQITLCSLLLTPFSLLLHQFGCRFWEMAIREHAAQTKSGRFDEALSSLFVNVDARTTPPTPLLLGDSIRTLRARAVLVDMEAGVLSELLRGPIGDVFDPAQLLHSESSGSGNNWACGNHFYGAQASSTFFLSDAVADRCFVSVCRSQVPRADYGTNPAPS